VQDVSDELLTDINRETTRCMIALVALQAGKAHLCVMLRLRGSESTNDAIGCLGDAD